MEKIAIATDSCSELTEEMKRTGPVFVVPLTVQVGGRSYRDGEEITGADVLRLLPKELPKTSLPGGTWWTSGSIHCKRRVHPCAMPDAVGGHFRYGQYDEDARPGGNAHGGKSIR